MAGKQDEWVRMQLRLPPELHAQVVEAATKANRSLNAEIVARLAGGFVSESVGAGANSLTEMVREEIEHAVMVIEMKLRSRRDAAELIASRIAEGGGSAGS